jgi:hypothetical protein
VYGGVPPYRETRQYVSRILRRIGRPDLVPQRVSSVNASVHASVIPVATSRVAPSHIDPGFALLSPPSLAPSQSSPSSAWAERQALERQVPAKIERRAAAAAPTATVAAQLAASPREQSWASRNSGGQGP